MAQAVRPDLVCRIGVADKRIVVRDPIRLAAFATEWVDADDGGQQRRRILAVLMRVVGAAAIAQAGVEHAEIGRALGGRWIERDGADVVRGRELRHAQDLPPGAFEDVGGRIGGRPLADDALLLAAQIGDQRIGRHGIVALWRGAEGDVEFAVAGLPGSRELRVEREPKQTRLVGECGGEEAHLVGAQIQIGAHRTAIRCGHVQRSAHIAERHAAGAVGDRLEVLQACMRLVRADRLGRIGRHRCPQEWCHGYRDVALGDRRRQRIRQGFRFLGGQPRGKDDQCRQRERFGGLRHRDGHRGNSCRLLQPDIVTHR